MVERRWLAVATAGVVLAVSVWGPWRAPKDPEQLFRKRCRSCHDLPDLSVYHRKDIRPIVTTMLMRNGASEFISVPEAEKIIAYLEETSPP